jgi:hypothetical protein
MRAWLISCLSTITTTSRQFEGRFRPFAFVSVDGITEADNG